MKTKFFLSILAFSVTLSAGPVGMAADYSGILAPEPEQRKEQDKDTSQPYTGFMAPTPAERPKPKPRNSGGNQEEMDPRMKAYLDRIGRIDTLEQYKNREETEPEAQPQEIAKPNRPVRPKPGVQPAGFTQVPENLKIRPAQQIPFKTLVNLNKHVAMPFKMNAKDNPYFNLSPLERSMIPRIEMIITAIKDGPRDEDGELYERKELKEVMAESYTKLKLMHQGLSSRLSLNDGDMAKEADIPVEKLRTQRKSFESVTKKMEELLDLMAKYV